MEGTKEITVYYYTAWDGFAWQGCDEATAKSLQRSMEATKTLPNSSSDHLPFGGAVPCKIGPDVGVAVYRYHTREKGDVSGRDSLYIALAFVPLSVGCVDFAKLLEKKELAETQRGALEPEKISPNGILLSGRGEDESREWLDKEELVDKYSELAGDGLTELSRLFFSDRTQLGFLNAVFESKGGVGEIVSRQTYKVNPVVQAVAKASDEFQKAKASYQGRSALPENHPAKVAMQDALEKLKELAERQREVYPGLLRYFNVKESELDEDEKLLEEISKYSEGLNDILSKSPVEEIKNDCEEQQSDKQLAERLDKVSEQQAKECRSEAKKVLEIKALSSEDPYREALQLAMRALGSSAYILGMKKGVACLRTQIKNLEAQLNKTQTELTQEKNNLTQEKETNKALSRKKAELEEDNSWLCDQLAKNCDELTRLTGKTIEIPRDKLKYYKLRSKDIPRKAGLFDRLMTGMIVVLIGVIIAFAVLIFRNGGSKKPNVQQDPVVAEAGHNNGGRHDNAADKKSDDFEKLEVGDAGKPGQADSVDNSADKSVKDGKAAAGQTKETDTVKKGEKPEEPEKKVEKEKETAKQSSTNAVPQGKGESAASEQKEDPKKADAKKTGEKKQDDKKKVDKKPDDKKADGKKEGKADKEGSK